jgi:hypothetical protein
MYKYKNPNPSNKIVGDCVVRAIAIALHMGWKEVYLDLCYQGLTLCDMPSSNHVWKSYLQDRGFRIGIIPNTCPDCYTIAEFAEDNRDGTYILGTGTHVVTVINGDYYDTWDSGEEVPIFYLYKEV